MKTYTKHTRGIGIVAIIAIIAVVSLGGFAAATVYQNQQAEVAVNENEMQEQAEARVEAAQEEARDDLLSLRANIAAGVNTSVDTTVNAIADIRTNLREAYAEGNAELQAEFNDIEESLDALEADVRANSEDAVDRIDEIMAKFEASVDSTFNMDANSEMNGEEDNANVEADGSATTSLDEGMIDVNLDSSVDGSGSMTY